MTGPEDTPTLANAGIPHFELTVPLVITPVSAEAAHTAVPLDPEAARAVAEHVARFVDVVMGDEPHSTSTQTEIDRALALGRHDIAHAAGLMEGRFLQHDVIEIEAGAACKAVADIRSQLEKLNPARQGDLFAPRRLLGFIPIGNRLKAYARQLEVGAGALRQVLIRLRAAEHDVQQAIVDIEVARGQVWEVMQKLASAARFAASVDRHMAERLPALQAGNPPRALLVEHQVLAVTRNLADILTQQAVCVNGYLVLDVLKKTGREMLNGCRRVATTTGAFVEETGRLDKAVGPAKLQELFDQACKAVEAMDSFRAKAKAVLRQNDSLMAERFSRPLE